MKESADVQRAAETVEAAREAIEQLEAQIAAEAEAIAARFDPDTPLDRVVLRPKRGDVTVLFVALAWRPEP